MGTPKDLPNGHERSYRRGFADAISSDQRKIVDDKINTPNDLPNGHRKSYERGFKDGLNSL